MKYNRIINPILPDITLFLGFVETLVMVRNKWKYVDRRGFDPLPAPPPKRYTWGRVQLLSS
jgi:hypothetical protein